MHIHRSILVELFGIALMFYGYSFEVIFDSIELNPAIHLGLLFCISGLVVGLIPAETFNSN